MEFAASTFQTGLMASVVAGFGATAVGALPVFLMNGMRERINNLLLSFAAGIMLAATVFSLLLPAVESARGLVADPLHAVLGVAAALLVGGITMTLAHRLLPHEHFLKGREGTDAHRISRIWLFVLAIAIHNLPEGLAVGVGAAGSNPQDAMAVTLGIAIQNLPEGLSVAVALLGLGYSRLFSFLIAAGTGLLEVLGGGIGAATIATGAVVLPWALGFAAGAMLFVVSDEIIPETHRPGMAEGATAALFVGFALMMVLDLA
jgi:ZIP family zinc transporter